MSALPAPAGAGGDGGGRWSGGGRSYNCRGNLPGPPDDDQVATPLHMSTLGLIELSVRVSKRNPLLRWAEIAEIDEGLDKVKLTELPLHRIVLFNLLKACGLLLFTRMGPGALAFESLLVELVVVASVVTAQLALQACNEYTGELHYTKRLATHLLDGFPRRWEPLVRVNTLGQLEIYLPFPKGLEPYQPSHEHFTVEPSTIARAHTDVRLVYRPLYRTPFVDRSSRWAQAQQIARVRLRRMGKAIRHDCLRQGRVRCLHSPEPGGKDWLVFVWDASMLQEPPMRLQGVLRAFPGILLQSVLSKLDEIWRGF
jgi:hypothetical protein